MSLLKVASSTGPEVGAGVAGGAGAGVVDVTVIVVDARVVDAVVAVVGMAVVETVVIGVVDGAAVGEGSALQVQTPDSSHGHTPAGICLQALAQSESSTTEPTAATARHCVGAGAGAVVVTGACVVERVVVVLVVVVVAASHVQTPDSSQGHAPFGSMSHAVAQAASVTSGCAALQSGTLASFVRPIWEADLWLSCMSRFSLCWLEAEHCSVAEHVAACRSAAPSTMRAAATVLRAPMAVTVWRL